MTKYIFHLFRTDLAKSLFQQPLFKTVFCLITLPAVLLSVIIWLDLRPNWEFTSKGVYNLYEYFKIPITIFASNIPILALLTADYRSKQSNRQMLLMEKQNTFSNFYKHKEEFHKVVKQLENEYAIKFNNLHNLYLRLFPLNCVTYVNPKSHSALQQSDSNYTDLTLLEESAKSLTKLVSILESKIPDEYSLDDPSIMNHILENFWQAFKISYNLNYDHIDGIVIKTKSGDKIRMGYEKGQPLYHMTVLWNIIDALSDFAQLYNRYNELFWKHNISPRKLGIIDVKLGSYKMLNENSQQQKE